MNTVKIQDKKKKFQTISSLLSGLHARVNKEAIIYVRTTEENKRTLEKTAMDHGTTVTAVVEMLIQRLRTEK